MKEREINTHNYFETIGDLGLENLPTVLKQSHKIIIEVTSNGTDWSKYKSEADFKRMMDLTCMKLQEFTRTRNGLSGIFIKKRDGVNPYQTTGKEVSIIRRILELNGKVLYKNTLEILIDELQNAFKNKEITKKSPVAKDMSKLEKFLVSTFNTTTNAKYLDLKPSTIKRYNSIIEKYENSYSDLDPNYAKSKKKSVGLQGIISSTDLAALEVPTIGFTGKWLKFIGDPCPGFKASVSGMPKMGKSFLCVEFADYLAKNHGKTLYVTKEEFMSPTFQAKLKQKNANSPNLDIAGSIPKNLSPYQSVFLDSVTRLKLTPDELRKLEEKNPDKNFVYVHQVTKDGKARGSNEYIHNVDVVIEVPERGKAIQYGRFNQGGELQIFEESNPDASLSIAA